jgi:glutathione synthase/RimK-type ligase-like ATP-grasp enzyme
MGHMIVIGIHPDTSGTDNYSEKWIEFLEKRGAQTRILNLLSPDALEQVQGCDGVMWRIIHCPQDKQSAMRILYVIEHYLNIPVFPNYNSAWHFDEKVAQYYLFQTLGVNTPKTWLFWNEEEALDWSRNAPYPLVFKLSVGAASSNVLKVENQALAVHLIKKSFEHGIFPSTMNEYAYKPRVPSLPSRWFWRPEFGYVYFQEFIPSNDYSTRITIIGDRAFGYRRWNRPGEILASSKRSFEAELIDLHCVEVAFQVSHKGDFQSMAYDFLSKEGKPVISEISYTFPDWVVHESAGYWQSDKSWVEGHIWPEEAQVDDLLSEIRGKG